jgi:hypothetical protein
VREEQRSDERRGPADGRRRGRWPDNALGWVWVVRGAMAGERGAADGDGEEWQTGGVEGGDWAAQI